MFAFWCVLSTIMMVEAILTLHKVRRFRSFFLRVVNAAALDPERWPRVALLAPCKGVDVNLRDNIQSWFSQQYPDFRIFFIVESDLDPALPILSDFPQAELIIAGQARHCGQKVHNLRYAIDNLPGSYEVFAFVDSDCLLKPDWLRNLVSQLLKTPENAATGYRWFTFQKNFGSLLRAVWNSSVLTLYEEDGKRNFAWGGSMAITRSTFESCRVQEFWRGSISDDYGLTNAMISCGRSVQFVPGAIALTTDCETLAGFFRWAFRQLLITRIYNPRLWFAALLFHSFWMLWIATGLFYPLYFMPVFLIVQFLQAMKADARLLCVPIGNRFFFWLTGPLIGVCNSMLLFGTLVTRRVVWRGREYILISKDRLTIREL
jgi:ceramide glucosyltransferase